MTDRPHVSCVRLHVRALCARVRVTGMTVPVTGGGTGGVRFLSFIVSGSCKNRVYVSPGGNRLVSGPEPRTRETTNDASVQMKKQVVKLEGLA